MRKVAVAILLAALGTFSWAAQPDVRNAQLTTEAAQPDLQQKVSGIMQSSRSQWVGYDVQTVNRQHNSDNGCGDVRYLEGDSRNQTFSGRQASTAILLRTESQKITKIDVVSLDCHIDAGGLPLHWLTGVFADQSVKLLIGLATNESAPKNLVDTALFAVSIHETASATQALNDQAGKSRDEHMKEQAAFWLATQRGHEGFLALKGLVRNGDAAFRKKLTFDFSQNSDPSATDELIRMARTDDAADVRGQAIFWLAQKAGKKQVATIADVAGNDPNTAVKKNAVFALTQLPGNESYDQLVKVAETNRDPAVRKDAIVWLGQSKDPRALEYLEQLIKR